MQPFLHEALKWTFAALVFLTVVAVTAYVGRLAERIPEPKLARQTRKTAIIVLVSAACFAALPLSKWLSSTGTGQFWALKAVETLLKLAGAIGGIVFAVYVYVLIALSIKHYRIFKQCLARACARPDVGSRDRMAVARIKGQGRVTFGLLGMGIVLLLAVAMTYSIRTARSAPHLARRLTDPWEWQRIRAATTLAELGPSAKEAIPALIAGLKDSNVEVRVQCAIALGKIGPDAKAATLALVGALSDREDEVRWTAASALGKIGRGAKQAVPALLKLVDREENAASRAVLLALERVSPDAKDAIPKLAERLNSLDKQVRRDAAAALVRIGAVP